MERTVFPLNAGNIWDLTSKESRQYVYATSIVMVVMTTVFAS